MLAVLTWLLLLGSTAGVAQLHGSPSRNLIPRTSISGWLTLQTTPKPVWTKKLPSGVVLHRYNRLVEGKVLVRDIGSLSYDGMAYQYGPETFDANSCEARCQRVRGCNAWAVCNWDFAKHDPFNAKLHPGCGAGCLDYGKTHKIWRSSTEPGFKSEQCSVLCSERMIGFPYPADFVGPYNGFRTDGCAWGCRDGKVCRANRTYVVPGDCMFPTCQNQKATYKTDKWAIGTCMLLQVTKPQAPALVKGEKGTGWLSGTITLPKECSEVSAHICQACHGLGKGNKGTAERCRACIKRKVTTGVQEVAYQDFAEVWCKDKRNGKFSFVEASSATRFSEFGCLYNVSKVVQGAVMTSVCEARRSGASRG